MTISMTISKINFKNKYQQQFSGFAVPPLSEGVRGRFENSTPKICVNWCNLYEIEARIGLKFFHFANFHCEASASVSIVLIPSFPL